MGGRTRRAARTEKQSPQAADANSVTYSSRSCPTRSFRIMRLDWDSLPVDERIISAVRDSLGFKQMTPVQSATVPILLGNKDVTVEAVTGSGKTLSFVIPLIQYVLRQNDATDASRLDSAGDHPEDDFTSRRSKSIYAIVVSPTRELAAQTHAVLMTFVQQPLLKGHLSSMLFVGGCSVNEDESRFNRFGGNIVVSTPGRLVDLLTKCKSILTSIRKNLHYLILDEADQLLEMGFDRQVNAILSHLPKQRRTGLFSATQTRELEQLVRAGLRDPVKIEIKQKVREDLKRKHEEVDTESRACGSVGVEKQKADSLRRQSQSATPANSAQPVLRVSQDLNNFHLLLPSYADKLLLLIRAVLLMRASRQPQKIIVFLASCAQVDYFSLLVSKFLTHCSSDQNNPAVEFSLLKLHRKLNKKRKGIFKRFSRMPRVMLLCTDIMARGIDVANVQWVIHFDLPNSLQSYVHRSGRSGHQFGEEGNSLLLALDHEQSFVNLCQQKKIETKPLKVAELMTRMGAGFEMLETGIQLQADEMREWIKDEARKDVDFYELGVQAFVSFVRTYSTKNILSHHLFPDLDVIDLVNSYGLLKVPVMPEYRKRFKEYQLAFQPFMKPQDSSILNEFRDILYKKNSKTTAAQDMKNQRRDELKRKRNKTRNKINSTKLKGKQKRALIDAIEFKELADDARIVKKLKRGQITEKKFDEHFGI